MKNFTLISLLWVVMLKVNAQPYVNIPDATFRDLIDSLAPGSIVGTTMNTNHPGVTGLMFMDVTNPAIYDITGIQYFATLGTLTCTGLGIGYVPAWPPNLTYLNFAHCPLGSLPALPASLQVLHLDDCGLSSLPSLPPNLSILSCSENNLTALPALPSSLYSLYCNDNLITSLPSLPSSLNYFDCRNNTPADPHSFLPQLPNSLQNLSASGNNIYCIPNIPNNGNFYSDVSTMICQPYGTPDSWYAMKPMTGGMKKELATSFSANGKGYVSCGLNSISSNDLWEFDPVANTWTQKANLPGVARISPFSFGIGTKGYLGCGQQNASPYSLNDFYEYNPVTNTWTQKSNYPGIIYYGMGSFVVNNKGYVAGGSVSYLNPLYNELYQYNPANDTWTQKTALTGYGRRDISCFAIGNKGYLCGGEYQNDLLSSCYAYDVTTDTWSQVASLPNSTNEYAAFALNGRGYIAAGQQGSWFFGGTTTLYEYDPGTNYWYRKADIPGSTRSRTTGFPINGKGYVTTGSIYNGQTGNYERSGEIFEYTPATCLPTITTITAGGPTTFCNGSNVTLSANPSAGLTYQWYNNGTLIAGATSANYVASASGSYTVVTTNAGGCSFTSAYTNVTSGVYPAAITPAGNTSVCPGALVNFSVNVCTSCSYQWYKSGVAIAGATGSSYSTSIAGYYSAKVTTPAGCTGTSASSLISIINTTPVVTVQGSSSICSGDSVRVYTAYGSGFTFQWYKDGSLISGATLYYYYAKTSGNYSISVNNSCGTFTSAAQTITVNPLPSAAITAGGPATFCSGGSVTLNAPAVANRSYQWIKDATNITGATAASYIATLAGSYKVNVTNTSTGCSKITANPTSVTVNPLPAAIITPQGPTTFCAGGSVVLQANTATGLTYKWKKGVNYISGATSSNYTATVAGTYKVEVTKSNGCTKTSLGVVVYVPCREDGLFDADNYNVTIYPDPANSELNLLLSSTDNFEFEILNTLGETLIKQQNKNVIDIANLSSGVYFIKIKQGDHLFTQKFVKQ
ncbi:MAG: kelch repeat-containing protein [Bacteroidia bacterium]